MQTDVVDEHPDVVVLAIGVNDVWHRFLLGRETTLEQFTENYNKLVEILKGTGAKLLLLQPFVLNMEDKPRLRPYLNKFNGAISEIAAREKLTLIPLDEMLATMYAVGRRIPKELRETALGGCAAAPSACRTCGGR